MVTQETKSSEAEFPSRNVPFVKKAVEFSNVT